MDEISDHRQTRLYHAKPEPPTFLYIAILGFPLTVMLLAVYPPRPKSILLMCFYCAFIGVVFYFILALNHPFEGIARVSPEPFEVIAKGFVLRP